MALLKKIGTIIIGVLLSIKALEIKVYEKSISDTLLACDYGIVEPVQKSSIILKIFTTIAIPIVLLIGLIVYFVKSKSKIWKKILVTISVVVLYIIFRIILSNI